MSVALTFVGDDAEIDRARDALDASRGPAWMEENALFFETCFVVDDVDVFRHGTRREETIIVGSDGRSTGVDYHPVSDTPRIPLLNVMASGRRAFETALATGRATWHVAGGGSVDFVELGGDSVRISGTGWTNGINEVASVIEVRAAFDAFRRSAIEYIATHLPELMDHPGWASALRAYD